MCFPGFTVSSLSADLENKSKKKHSCQTLGIFFPSKLKRAFSDVEHFWMTSAVLSEAAPLWSVYVLSVAAVSPQRICSDVVRLPGLWLNLFCLSLHLVFLFLFFFSSLLPLHRIAPHCLSPFLCRSLNFHNSLLLLQCLHLLFIVMSDEYKPYTLI